MPSYRLHLPIGALREGARPEDVLEQAVLALGSLPPTRSRSGAAPLSGGWRSGRIGLRCGGAPGGRAAEDDAARHALAAVVEHLEETVCEVAPAGAIVLSRGSGGRFRPIPPSRPGA